MKKSLVSLLRSTIISVLTGLSVLLQACSETPAGTTEEMNEKPLIHQSASVEILSENLLGNASSENGQEGPDGWQQDAWGENTPSLQWRKSDAFDGQHYLKVSLTDYKSGDGKWVFDTKELEPGWYQYSNYNRSDGRSRLVKVCEDSEGKRVFHTIGQTHQSQDWKKDSVRFYHSKNVDCKLSIMHILDRNGFLDTDQFQLVKIKARPFSEPMVSISFDDIWATAATRGATELQKRGWLGSFYITKDFAENPQGKYASVEQIKTLIASGHEVGTHGEKHSFLSQESALSVTSELNKSLFFLQQLRGSVKGIAYPFGDFNQVVEDESRRQYTYARTSLHGLNDLAIDPYRLKIFAVTNETKNEELIQMVDQAIESSSWLIILFHGLGKIEKDNTYLTDTDQYIQTLDYIKQKQLKVLTVAEGVKLLN